MYTLKKSLGQHFLKDENISKKIVAAIQQHAHHKLLEIGPGGGALTKYLLELPLIDFKAVEIYREKSTLFTQRLWCIKRQIDPSEFLRYG